MDRTCRLCGTQLAQVDPESGLCQPCKDIMDDLADTEESCDSCPEVETENCSCMQMIRVS